VPAVWAIGVLWAFGGVSSQLVLVGVNALVLRTSGANMAGSTSVVQSFRFTFAALAPVVIMPIYHAEAALAFIAPAASLLLAGPPALPRREEDTDGENAAKS